jgi:hypothetical protein
MPSQYQKTRAAIASAASPEHKAAVELRKAAQRFCSLGEPTTLHDEAGRAANRALLAAALAYAEAKTGFRTALELIAQSPTFAGGTHPAELQRIALDALDKAR